MGFLNILNIRKGMRQVRLLRSATENVHSGDMASAMEEIFKYYGTDPLFDQVLREFNATRDDIEAIILGCRAAGTGTYRGHFVPVSAVLYPMTLSYLLRSQRGEVPKAEAYYHVDKYFESGALVFEAERAVRQRKAAPNF
jgi:hypothetical protein